jgi:hypothetical protein
MSHSTPASDRNVAGIVVVGIVVALFGLPIVALGGHVAWWAALGGPPLDFDAPHNGRVVAHIDVLGRYPPDIVGIRISEATTHAVVWDVKPLTGKSECWNGCWNLTLTLGDNPASFVAGHQEFVSQFPSSRTFSLYPRVQYLFEVWDSKGRIERQRFTL